MNVYDKAGVPQMLVNGRLRPAAEWCREFGHEWRNGWCVRCEVSFDAILERRMRAASESEKS